MASVFDWDEYNLRKIRPHGIKPDEVEQALSDDPIWMPDRSESISLGECWGNEPMKKKTIDMPVFQTESQEADWWASREGREFVKRKSAELRVTGTQSRGSRLVANLNKTSSTQIALLYPKPIWRKRVKLQRVRASATRLC